jgi:hypothetical protein
MKESTELFVALFKTVNSIVLAAADKKIDANDIGLIIPLIISWQAAIKDLTFAQEASNATATDIETMFNTAAKELNALPADVRYAVINIAKGGYIGYWLAARKGFEAGYSAAIAAANVR